MKLRNLLHEIKCLPRDLELYIHEIDKDGKLHYKPLKGINLSMYDKRLSFGVEDFNKLMFETQRKKGVFNYDN